MHHITQSELLGHPSYLQLQLSGMIHTIIVGHLEQPMGTIMSNQTSMPFITSLTCQVLRVASTANKIIPCILDACTTMNNMKELIKSQYYSGHLPPGSVENN